MKIIETSVKKPVTMSMIFLAVIVLSMVSFSRLSIDLFPDITFPTITVFTSNSGMGPEEIESNITQKIEEVVGTVNNIKKITSTSVEGMSVVSIEFVWGTQMSEAASDVREKLDLIASKLPDSADKPMTFKFDAAMIPVYGFCVLGVELSKAKKFAEDVIKPELEQLKGVSQAQVQGGLKEQVQINIDRNRLKAYNLSFAEIIQILAAENINQPAGSIKIGYEDFTIRTEGEYKTLEEIKKVVVGVKGTTNKKPVYIEDVAEVKSAFYDKNDVRIVGQSEAVAVTCNKQSGENTVEVADRIIAKLEQIKKRAPQGMRFQEFMNSGDHIKRSINNIAGSARDAGVLAILIILLFLGNIRSTFIVALSIPISIIVTFLFMFLGGLTLNLISFGGLALGIGMLVDNAIVVLENIYRHRQLGEDNANAAIKGTKEIAMPIIAGTLTTICVFLPLMFVQGVSGEFFKEMALTVTFSLTASLVVALTLIPMLSSKMLVLVDKKNQKIKRGTRGLFQKLSIGIENTLEKLNVAYGRGVAWALAHRKLVLFGVIGAFVVSIMVFSLVQKGFMPESDDDRLTVDLELKEGTRLEVTEKLAFLASEKITSVEGVESFTASMGIGNNFFSLMQGKAGSHIIAGRIRLVKAELGRPKAYVIREQIRNLLEEIPGIKVKFATSGAMGSTASPVQIEVRGKDLDGIYDVAKKVKAIIDANFSHELKDVFLSRSEGTEEIIIKIDRIKASTMGFNVSMIASTIQSNFIGITATKFKTKGDEIDIVARLSENQRLTEQDLLNIVLKSPLGFSVPMSQVVSVSRGYAPAKIERKSNERVVYVNATNMPDVGVANVVDSLAEKISQQIVLPDGVNLFYGGSYEDSQESFRDLGLALMLAILLIYMVMAAQFESLLNPFLILSAIPLAFIGVIWILFLTATEFNVISFIGVIIMVGVAVNNGIVLIDYIRQLREDHGYDLFKAIITAGRTRLRPILMTTLTTVIGMLPMALSTGPGSESSSPMAMPIVGGLTVTTLLTLFFLPVVYSMVATSTIKRRKRRLSKKEVKNV